MYTIEIKFEIRTMEKPIIIAFVIATRACTGP